MKHCPNCGAKDYSADHRGSYTKEKCKSCAGGKSMANCDSGMEKSEMGPKVPKGKPVSMKKAVKKPAKMLAKKRPNFLLGG